MTYISDKFGKSIGLAKNNSDINSTKNSNDKIINYIRGIYNGIYNDSILFQKKSLLFFAVGEWQGDLILLW